MSDPVAYNPNDANQQRLLSALALGESGGDYHVGTGGVGLSNVATDAYGFPIWNGTGNSHAAGAFQFQPGTWKAIAAKYGLNFQNPADQNAGAWYDAQQVFQAKTGGSLEDALAAGNYQLIEQSLGQEWTSAPGKLATALKNGLGAALAPGSTSASLGQNGTPSITSDPVGAVSAYFVRGGLILVGALVLVVALWALLSQQKLLPNAVSLG